MPLQPSGDDVYSGRPPMQTTRKRRGKRDWSSLKDAAEWELVSSSTGKVKKENRLGALWQDIRETLSVARRPPHPMAHSIAKAKVDPDYLAAQSLVAITDRYLGDGHAVEYANHQALALIEKDADNSDLRLNYTRWPAGPDGMDLHLGSGRDRAPGYVGVDLYAYDHGTSVHDLNLGIPFPNACARSMMVTKALGDIVEDVPALVEEIGRVLAPGGAVVTERRSRLVSAITKELGDGYVRHGSAFLPKELPGDVSEIILKEDGGAPIIKSWPTERIIYSVVLEPDFIDAHNDTMRAEDIQKTAHQYIQDCRVVAHRHGRSIDAHPVESYIAPQDLNFTGGPYGDQVVKKGSWVVGLKINDPECWDKVLSGEFTGVSIGGRGSRRPL